MVVVADHVDTNHCPIMHNLHILLINHTATVGLLADRQEAEQRRHEDDHLGGTQVTATAVFTPIFIHTSRLKIYTFKNGTDFPYC